MIGSHVEEAVSRTEKFLDEALVSELKSVRLIHGYGTGQLRRALAEFLQSHPFVAQLRPAPANQGGGGVTVVRFEETRCRSFPATFVADLKSQADIVQVVQERVPLRRSGVAWKGLCPFHGEKTPSFQVNGEKGVFHCFGAASAETSSSSSSCTTRSRSPRRSGSLPRVSA